MEPVYCAAMTSSLLQEVFVSSTATGACMVNFLTSETAFMEDIEAAFQTRPMGDEQRMC